jgi:Resolvase, N terminal domain
MLDCIAGNGVRSIVIESPDRFARDLAVQLAGHDYLKGLGIALIPATAPDFFLEDTPTAVLVRQVLDAVAQFDKATLVAKLRAARDRKIAAGEKCGGRLSYAERDGGKEMVALARELRGSDGRPRSLRKIAAGLASVATSRRAAGLIRPRQSLRCSRSCLAPVSWDRRAVVGQPGAFKSEPPLSEQTGVLGLGSEGMRGSEPSQFHAANADRAS